MTVLDRVADPLRGERILKVVPAPAAETAAGWRRRVRYFEGRSLTEQAFLTERNHRSGHLALAGQSMSHGVVNGLEARLDGGDLRIAPGQGIAPSGEDVVVPAEMRVPLSGFDLAPGVSIVVLQPVTAELARRRDPDDPCEVDPAADAFAQWQTVDACRVLLYPWEAPPRGPQWRNRVAWAIFDEEKNAGGLLWDELGIAVAAIGFGPDRRPEFIDRFSVARHGGQPRRSELVATRGTPFLWEARIRQFAEQMAAESGTPARFRYLPPAGVLPLDAVDPRAGHNHFFPLSYIIEAEPVPEDQIEADASASAALAPFDTEVADRVRVLVPVPNAFYDPRLLVTEQVDPEIPRTIEQLVLARGRWLQRRADVRHKHEDLLHAATGKAFRYPAADPDAAEQELVASGPIDPPEDAYVVDLAPLKKTLAACSLSEDHIRRVDRGLEPFIAFLDQKVREADDAINFGFLRVRSDMYRVRFLMSGDADATRLATSPVLAGIAQGSTAVDRREDLRQFYGDLKKTFGSEREPPADTRKISLPASERYVQPARKEQFLASRAITERDVAQENEIPATIDDLRSTNVAERLAEPPSKNAKTEAVATKLQVFRSATAFPLNVADLALPGFKGDASKTVADITPQVLNEIAQGVHDEVAAQDEARYFAAGVRAIENATAVLRLLEARTADYRSAIDATKETLAEVRSTAAAAEKRLAAIAVELAEARHDVAVARALLAEEQARVARVNAERDQVYARHVRYLAFCRPRAAGTLRDAPVRPLYAPQQVDSPLPECLSQRAYVPPELQSILDVLREIPLNRFSFAPNLVENIDRHDVFRTVWNAARNRVPPAMEQPSGTVAAVVAAHGAEAAARRSALAAAPPDFQTWGEARDRALELLALADFLPWTQTSAPAAQRLELISRAAGCIYARFGDTPAAYRLDWTESLSVFDKPVDLRQLSVLPRFHLLDFELAHDLQALVDWLFGALKDTALASDIVRVAILIASHAPVRQPIGGYLTKPAVVAPGRRIAIASESKTVRRGMQVLFYAGDRVVGRGVIDDMSAEEALAQVVEGEGITLAASARVQCIEPEP